MRNAIPARAQGPFCEGFFKTKWGVLKPYNSFIVCISLKKHLVKRKGKIENHGKMKALLKRMIAPTPSPQFPTVL
jgi:hypothetical protein